MIETDRHRAYLHFGRAVCPCGWTGPLRKHRFLARLDAKRHSGRLPSP